ncbi:MAG: thrombospondin type 3 repeat-containing protein, partial [Planctomycetes bacterium]|nr:thrombospondin type 3 repeat-containing protein [Planctomycetota bacterium]
VGVMGQGCPLFEQLPRPEEEQLDTDNDGVLDNVDNCPSNANADQADADNDGVGDVCDNCPAVANNDQADADNDGVGDACEPGAGGDTGNSAVTGKYVSAEPVVVTDSTTDEIHVGCGFCHPDKHTNWLTTQHSKALEALEAVGQGTNAACLGCHTVGFGEEGGFVDRATTNALAGVQCENCHGAGSEHVANIMDPTKYPLHSLDVIGADICGKCHTGDHQPTFDEWSESHHAGGEFWEADAADFLDPNSTRLTSCGLCHSGDYRQLALEEGQTVTSSSLVDYGYTTLDQLHPQVCVVCHSPHRATGLGSNLGEGRDSQLNYPLVAIPDATNDIAEATNPDRFNVCGQCHHLRSDTNKTATGSDTWKKTSRPVHRSGQSNMGNGEMPIPAGTLPLVPNGAHYHFTATPRQCATCHMKPEEQVDPADPTPTNISHKFEVDTAACSDCHPVVNPETLKTTFQNRTQGRLDAIKARLDAKAGQAANWWQYSSSSYGGPAGAQTTLGGYSEADTDKVKQIRYIYYFVLNDGSGGIHNPNYTDDLLRKAEDLLTAIGL